VRHTAGSLAKGSHSLYHSGTRQDAQQQGFPRQKDQSICSPNQVVFTHCLRSLEHQAHAVRSRSLDNFWALWLRLPIAPPLSLLFGANPMTIYLLGKVTLSPKPPLQGACRINIEVILQEMPLSKL
jgi:hypothetical protein